MAAIIMLPFFYITLFHVQKLFVQIEMRQKLKHQQQVTLHIKADKIQWHKKGKEIKIEGSLFDVESITYKSGLATIKGLYDKKEKEIDKQIAKAYIEPQNNTLNITLVKLLGFYFIANLQVSFLRISAFQRNTPQLGWVKAYKLPANYSSVPTPPPLGKLQAIIPPY